VTPALSRTQVRDLDRRAIAEFGVPGVVLMENAGRGAAELLLSLGVSGRVVICCGRGNNGGDGFVIARHLDLRGVDVQVLLFEPPDGLKGDALVNYEIVRRSKLPVDICTPGDVCRAVVSRYFNTSEWLIDALFGTGLDKAPREPYAQVINRINHCRAKVIAVDVPSGLDCDTGLPLGEAVRARHTATFVALKHGFLNPDAAAWLGQVHVIDIGAPRVLVEAYLNPPSA
jgi:NAD(P)H-hydrate epimerase